MPKAKKIFLIAFLLLICAVLTGCERIEISRRAFAGAVAVDREGSAYTVLVEVNSLGDGGVSSEYLAGSGRTIPEALMAAEETQGKKLFLGHCRSIIAGSGIKNLREELVTFKNESSVSPKTEIILARSGAEFLKSREAIGASDRQDDEGNGGFKKATLCDVYADDTGLFPIGAGEDSAVIKNGEIKGRLRGNAARGACILLGHKKEFMEVVSKDGISNTVWIDSSSLKFLPEYKKGKLALKIFVDLKGRADGKLSIYDSETRVMESVTDYCAKAVSESSSMGVDFLNLYERIYMKFPASREEFKNFLDEIPVEIKVCCKLESKKNF